MTKNPLPWLALIVMLLPALPRAEEQQTIRDAYLRSFTYESTENYSAAIKALMPLLKQYPEGYTLNLRLGWLHYLQGRYANSIRHYQQAVQVAPRAVEPRLGLLLPLLAKKSYDEAERLARQILQTDHFNYYANQRLIVALEGQKKYEAARKIAISMLTLYPTDTLFLEHLAWLHLQLGDTEAAAAAYRDLRILDPENLAAKRYLEP